MLFSMSYDEQPGLPRHMQLEEEFSRIISVVATCHSLWLVYNWYIYAFTRNKMKEKIALRRSEAA